MKHFEHLWEEAEKLSIEKYKGLSMEEVVSRIASCAKDQSQFGELVLLITFISKTYNINSYTALQTAISDSKIDMLEDS